MNITRVILAALVAFVVTGVIGFVVNNSLFGWVYATSQGAMRPRAERAAHLPYLLLVLFLGNVAFAYLYARGFQRANGIGASIRLAMILAVAVVLPGNIWQWALYPISARVPLVVIPWEFLTWVLTAMIVAAVYRPTTSVSRGEPAALS